MSAREDRAIALAERYAGESMYQPPMAVGSVMWHIFHDTDDFDRAVWAQALYAGHPRYPDFDPYTHDLEGRLL